MNGRKLDRTDATTAALAAALSGNAERAERLARWHPRAALIQARMRTPVPTLRHVLWAELAQLETGATVGESGSASQFYRRRRSADRTRSWARIDGEAPSPWPHLLRLRDTAARRVTLGVGRWLLAELMVENTPTDRQALLHWVGGHEACAVLEVLSVHPVPAPSEERREALRVSVEAVAARRAHRDVPRLMGRAALASDWQRLPAGLRRLAANVACSALPSVLAAARPLAASNTDLLERTRTIAATVSRGERAL